MKTFRGALSALFMCAAMAVAACSTTTYTLTPNEKEVAALSTVTTARQSADQLLLAKRISPDEAQSINTKGDTIVALVRNIRALPAGDASLATDLAQLQTLVAALRDYVSTVGNQK